MKENGEWEEKDIELEKDLDLILKSEKEIAFFIEPLFDVDKKFHLDLINEDAWMYMYGIYNPYKGVVEIECSIMRSRTESSFVYYPTEEEERLVRNLIETKLLEKYKQTPKEFCEHLSEKVQKIADLNYKREVTCMKANGEWEEHNLEIDNDMEVDCDIGQEITFSMRLWFDVDKKFHLHINEEENAWLNIYGKYNPYADTLRLECEIDRETKSSYFFYEPTNAESKLIKDMVSSKLQYKYHQMPQEFCEYEVKRQQKMGD